MLNVAKLRTDLEAKRTEGKALLLKYGTLAESENRRFTESEETELRAIAAECRDLQDKIDTLQGHQTITEQINAMIGETPRRPAVHKSLGQQFLESEAFAFIRAGGHRAQSSWRSPGAELMPRFWGATLTEDPASGGALVLPDYQAGIRALPTRRLMVADLFAPGTTDSNVVSYMQETLFTNAAAPVLEGGLKPESTLTFAPVTDPVRKIAHWLPVTEEMLEDVSQIRSYIDARLTLGVQIAEEDQLLNGSGVAPNILGVEKRAALAADVVRAAAENNADAIFRQIMAIYGSSYLMPDGITMNPADWSVTALMKTTQGVYLAGGPFAPLPAPTLWGLPVAVTPVQLATAAFVGAYKQAAQVFRKGGIRVEASNSHSDFFVKNLVAIRAEERLALAVYRPGAFGEVTGLGTPV